MLILFFTTFYLRRLYRLLFHHADLFLNLFPFLYLNLYPYHLLRRSQGMAVLDP
jgi:hypothetical protein